MYGTRAEEIENVETWARNNKLTLNKSKTSEVVFRDARRKQKATMPPQLSGMERNTLLNILGVTLSVSDHIRGVLGKCSQTLYALRVLRSHGLCDAGLQTFFTASLWPSCCMLLRLGADSRLLMTVNELTHFYAGASDVVSVGKTYRCSRNCWKIVMNIYLTRL